MGSIPAPVSQGFALFLCGPISIAWPNPQMDIGKYGITLPSFIDSSMADITFVLKHKAQFVHVHVPTVIRVIFRESYLLQKEVYRSVVKS